MHTIKFYLSVLFGLAIMSCSSGKKWSAKVSPPIVFGSFGGFAGSYSEYTLHDNGDVHYRSALKGEHSVIENIDETTLSQLFQSIETLELYELEVSDPGNMTYFLKFNYKNEGHELQWGGNNVHVPDKLITYFRLLRSLTKNKNPIM